jgi:hypothetical protein
MERSYVNKHIMNYLSQFNALFIRFLSNLLGIKTKITSVMDYNNLFGDKNEVLINLIKQIGGEE